MIEREKKRQILHDKFMLKRSAIKAKIKFHFHFWIYFFDYVFLDYNAK